MKISVVLDKNLWRDKRVVGEARYTEQLIVIDSSVLTEQGMLQSYYHELVHHILFILNEEQLRSNEKFVDTFAHMIHQAAQAKNMYTFEELKA